MEQLLSILVLGVGFIAVLTFIRTIASLLRVGVVLLLAVAIGFVAVKGKLPLQQLRKSVTHSVHLK